VVMFDKQMLNAVQTAKCRKMQ